MKKFILEEILLMSPTERKARRVKFDPKTTIILGENDTGKSSLIKSIFWTFGAEAPDIHPDWRKAKVISVAKFSVNTEKYTILRSENFFALFDAKNNLIGTYTSVTNELGPKLAEIFDFKIKLITSNGHEITPPPAFYFLPFYIDQDTGWGGSWSSFIRLGQLSKWRTPIVEYHTGIKNNEYYEIKSKLDLIKLATTELGYELKFFQGALDQAKKDIESINFSIDVNQFRTEIENLMKDLKKLQNVREDFKTKLVERYNLQNNLLIQIDVVSKTLSDVRGDYKYANSHDEIDCPVCGQTYENSFAERFSIAEDEHTCSKLLSQLNVDLITTKKDLEDLTLKHNSNELEIADLQELLAKKQGHLSLNDVIKNEGKKQLKELLNNKIESLAFKITKKELEQSVLVKEQRELAKRDKEKKGRIMDSYHQNMRSYLQELDVKKLGFDTFKKIDFKVTESGSDKPRALLAYYFSILNVMLNFTSTVFAPIIIDSPNQQDQDKSSLKKMLEFIRDEKIEGTQLILGLTDLHKIEYKGKIIRLEKKYSVMLEDQYKDVFSEISPLLDKSLLK